MDGDHEEAMRQRMAFFFLRGTGARDGNFDGQRALHENQPLPRITLIYTDQESPI